MTIKRFLQQKYVEDLRAENAELRQYIKDNNFEEPDLIFTFLTGNGLYIPYAEEFPKLGERSSHL